MVSSFENSDVDEVRESGKMFADPEIHCSFTRASRWRTRRIGRPVDYRRTPPPPDPAARTAALGGVAAARRRPRALLAAQLSALVRPRPLRAHGRRPRCASGHRAPRNQLDPRVRPVERGAGEGGGRRVRPWRDWREDPSATKHAQLEQGVCRPHSEGRAAHRSRRNGNAHAGPLLEPVGDDSLGVRTAT
jgi:hypothetical protein